MTWSFRTRMNWYVIGVSMLFSLLFCSLTFFIMRHEMNEIMDGSIRETAERLVPLSAAMVASSLPVQKEIKIFMDLPEHEETVFYQVRDQRGAVLFRSHDKVDTGWGIPLETGYFNYDDLRIFSLASPNHRFIVQVADSLQHRRQALTELAVGLLLTVTALISAIILVFNLMSKWIMAPLFHLRSEIEARSARRLDPIQLSGLPDELIPILNSSNALLKRLKEAIDAEQRFTSNCAHELRNPVAAAQGQAQLLALELVDTEYKGRSRKLAESLLRLSSIVDKLLVLARSQVSEPLQKERVRLDHLIEDRIAYHISMDDSLKINLDIDAQAELEFETDPGAIEIILNNLIENARLHGGQSDPITIRLRFDRAFSVINRGFAAPVDTLANRFTRGPTSAPGAGLGLSIVNELAQALGARLQLFSPAAGYPDGFEARISFAP